MYKIPCRYDCWCKSGSIDAAVLEKADGDRVMLSALVDADQLRKHTRMSCNVIIYKNSDNSIL